MMQKTLKKQICLSGTSLHSGRTSNITINPAAANTGIFFRRVDQEIPRNESIIKASIDNIEMSELCTKISNNYGHSVSTIEHLMSAIHGMGIDNAIIDIDSNEVPILDGSSAIYVYEIEKAGLKELKTKKKAIKIIKPLIFGDNDKYIKVTPSDKLDINYTIVYDHELINTQSIYYEHENLLSYKNIISNSRTFGFRHELEKLRNRGLIAGGSLNNAIVLDHDGIMNNTSLRHKDEFVRHKVLDFIGDILLLGHTVLGSFEILRGGHKLTHEIVKLIALNKDSWTICSEEVESKKSNFSETRLKREQIASL